MTCQIVVEERPPQIQQLGYAALGNGGIYLFVGVRKFNAVIVLTLKQRAAARGAWISSGTSVAADNRFPSRRVRP